MNSRSFRLFSRLAVLCLIYSSDLPWSQAESRLGIVDPIDERASIESHSLFLDTSAGMGTFWNDGLAYLSAVLESADGKARSLDSTSLSLACSKNETEVLRPSDLQGLAKAIKHDSLRGQSRLAFWLNSMAASGGPKSLAIYVGTWPEALRDLRIQLSARDGWKAPAIGLIRFTPDLPPDEGSSIFSSLFVVVLGERAAVTEFAALLNGRGGIDYAGWPHKDNGLDVAIVTPRPFSVLLPLGSWNSVPEDSAGFSNDGISVNTGREGPVINCRQSKNGQISVRFGARLTDKSVTVVRNAANFTFLNASPRLALSNSDATTKMALDQLDWQEVQLNQRDETLVHCDVKVKDPNSNKSSNPPAPFMNAGPGKTVEVNDLILELNVNHKRILALYPDAKTAEIKILLTGRSNEISFPSWVKDHNGSRAASIRVNSVSVHQTPGLVENMRRLSRILEESWSERAAQGFAEDVAVTQISALVKLDNR